MWSPFYYYFQVRPCDQINSTIRSQHLATYLLEELQFTAVGPDGFEGNENQPWISLSIHHSKNGNYSSQDVCPNDINLIAFVGSKTTGDKQSYVELLLRMAKWLKWELFEEEDDDGNEDVLIWAPGLDE